MSETGSNTPLAPSAPRPEIPIEEDPKKYMQTFRSSATYSTGLAKFYEGKNLAPDVTETEKKDVFESGEFGKAALLDFAQHTLKFKYNPSQFNPEAREALDDYIATVRDFFKAYREGGQDQIISADAYRTMVHNKAARVLADNGYTSGDKQGRTLARLVLIDKGLDTFENAGINDLERAKRQLGATG